MLKDSKANDQIVTNALEWKASDISLCHTMPFAEREQIGVRFNGATQVYRRYNRLFGKKDFRKTPSSTSGFKNHLPRK